MDIFVGKSGVINVPTTEEGSELLEENATNNQYDLPASRPSQPIRFAASSPGLEEGLQRKLCAGC